MVSLENKAMKGEAPNRLNQDGDSKDEDSRPVSIISKFQPGHLRPQMVSQPDTEMPVSNATTITCWV